jgi:hypothetical protein
MRLLFGLLLCALLFACTLDNTSYPTKLVEIKNNNSEFEVTLSTSVDLKAIKEKYHFTDQRVIGTVKTQSFKEQKISIEGAFDTNNQQKIGEDYLYKSVVNLKSKDGSTDLKHLLTEKDTIEMFLQLGFTEGRTYPTKPVFIPATAFLK